MNFQVWTEEDLPWLVTQSRYSYAKFFPNYCDFGALSSLKEFIQDPDFLCLRGPGVAAVIQFVNPAWAPLTRFCYLVRLFGKSSDKAGLEALKIVRELDRLRKNVGCVKFYIGSEYVDLSAIAKSLGGKPTSMQWELN